LEGPFHGLQYEESFKTPAITTYAIDQLPYTISRIVDFETLEALKKI
jgi:hypothetical protein